MEMIGIDVGGSGIKAAIVETATGELTTPRVRVETPQPSTPKAVAKATAGLIADLPPELSAGIGFPAVILRRRRSRRPPTSTPPGSARTPTPSSPTRSAAR